MYDNKSFLKNKQHFFDEFKFKNGQIIENAKVDYGVVGTPKYDEDGNIINAILFCHNFQDDYTVINNFKKEKAFDLDEYFFISITSLGFFGSCSPSNTGLKRNFPRYCIEDLVNFQRQLIKEKFPNIKKLKGIIGYSFGGYIALGWAINFPDEIDFIIHLKSSYKTQGFKYVYANISNRVLESSKQYDSDLYDESSSNDLIWISQLHYIMNYSKQHICSLSNDEIAISIDSVGDEVLFYDVFDIKVANDFLLTLDLEDELDKIKCKVLIIAVNNSNYYVPEYDALPIHEAIRGSEYILLDIEDKANELDYLYKIKDDVKKFVDSV